MPWGKAVAVTRQERMPLHGSSSRPRPPHASELAWIVLLPCAAILLVAIVVLGPPLGRIALRPSGLTFWPSVIQQGGLRPEPTEQARYLIALTGPLLLSGAIAFGARRARPLRPEVLSRLVLGSQALALGFVVVCVLVQDRHVFQLPGAEGTHTFYFTAATLAAAAAIALMLAAMLRSARARRRLATLARERAGRRTVADVLAVLATALWLLPAVNFEKTIVYAHEQIVYHMPFWLDETFAVLDGRYPLVDFAAQYGSLWPYPIAGAMALLGSSLGVFTVVMSAIGAAAMAATFATLRRLVASSVVALVLFLPVLATSFFMIQGPLDNRYAVGNLFGTFPLRYAGPLLLLWLVARHLDGSAPRRRAWLCAAAGVVALNNADFGVPALGATLAALLWSSGRPTRGSLGRLALDAVLGLLAAYALVSVLTVIVAGSLPHLGLLFRYARLFALTGWGLLPMTPTIGMSTIIYLTYVAAIGAATVRATRREPDRMMTGLLAWSGVFGLGVGSYYMGRSHPEVLTNMFCAWALSVTFLVVLAARSIVARGPCLPTIAEAACLFAFGVLVCSLAQTPTPWSQIARLRRTGIAIYAHPEEEPFVAAHTHRGEPVAILTVLGHRVAYDLGLGNVTPYTGQSSMPTVDQLDETLAALRKAGGRSVFLLLRETWREVPEALMRRGYVRVAQEPYGMQEFSLR